MSGPSRRFAVRLAGASDDPALREILAEDGFGGRIRVCALRGASRNDGPESPGTDSSCPRFVAGIHVLKAFQPAKTWMAGTKPGHDV